MISIFDKNNKLNEHRNSLDITYPRRVNIIYGNYPYPEILNYFMIKIRDNLDVKMKNQTNVKGKMTSWGLFLEDENFKKFIVHLINKYQFTHPAIFEHFLQKKLIKNAWGNEIKSGDSLTYHTHPEFHGILYLTQGCDLIFPELNIKMTPEPGDYYILPGHIYHGFDTYVGETNRYSLAFNITQHHDAFEYTRLKNGTR